MRKDQETPTLDECFMPGSHLARWTATTGSAEKEFTEMWMNIPWVEICEQC